MCRGEHWQKGRWPIGKGEISLQQCANACAAKAGCTAFDMSHQYGDKDHEDECLLYGHKKVAPADQVPGSCYVLDEAANDKAPKKPKSDKAKKGGGDKKRDKKAIKEEKKASSPKKGKKIPKFDPPRVVEDEDDKDDDDWLFEPPPPEVRSREHIADILGLDEATNEQMGYLTEKTLKELKKIYEGAIKPLEGIYKYRELSNRHFGDPEIFGKPLVVLMGPYSGGKSSMINYLLGTEYTPNAFKVAAEPSPGFNFNIALHGEQTEELGGTELAAEFEFSSLQKFGQEFLKKLRARRMPNKLLERVSMTTLRLLRL